MLVYLNESVHFYGLKCCEVEGRIPPGSFYDTIDILVATNEWIWVHLLFYSYHGWHF